MQRILHNTILVTEFNELGFFKLLTMVTYDPLDAVSLFVLNLLKEGLDLFKGFRLLMEQDDPCKFGEVIHNHHNLYFSSNAFSY